MTESTTNNKKTLRGKVFSNKMEKTIVVAVERYVKHPKYGKYIRRTEKYKVHSPEKAYAVGDMVTIRESRPISKDKHFIVVE